MKKRLENCSAGFYLVAGAALLGAVSAIAYLLVYQLTAVGTVDRVFSWLTFAMVLGGSLLGLGLELVQFPFGVLLAVAGVSVGFANHMVEFAYPIADKLTGVAFFGGSFPMALVFAILFGVTALCLVASAFMKHQKS